MFVHTTNYKDIKPPAGSQLNRGHPLAQGLVGCWLMNEGGGTIAKELALGMNGALMGTAPIPFFSTSPIQGVKFNNATGYIYAARKSQTNNLRNMTILTQFYALGIGEATSGRIIAKRTTTTGWHFSLRGTNGLVFFRDWSGGDLSVYSVANAYSFNRVVQAGAVYNGSKVASEQILYVNGLPVGQDSSVDGVTNFSDDSDDDFTIGNVAAETNTFNGYIGFAYLWNRRLSSQEILSLYTAPYQMIQAPRRVFYSFASGTTTPPVISSRVRGYMTTNRGMW